MLSTLPKLKQSISPSEMFDAGYRDGLQGRKNYRLLSNSDYLRGSVAGERENPNSLFNLPPTQESYLERGWGDELLNTL